MYKIEPVVADGGEVVIYAPHVDRSELRARPAASTKSATTAATTSSRSGSASSSYPGGILAHSTHVKGLGTYDASTGLETPRIRVTLATGIPRERCERINLGYRDPASIDPAQLGRDASRHWLVVPRAGEMLYRVGQPPNWGN